MELIFFFMWFLPLLVTTVLGIVYVPARLEWNDTFKRAALIAKANLGSRKAEEVLTREKIALTPYIGDPDDKVAKLAWESQFSGKEIAVINKDAHYIAESYNKLVQGPYDDHPIERWFWKCACGEAEDRKSPDAAKQSAKRHLALYRGRNSDHVKDQGWLKL